jgi:hypothetical protein
VLVSAVVVRLEEQVLCHDFNVTATRRRLLEAQSIARAMSSPSSIGTSTVSRIVPRLSFRHSVNDRFAHARRIRCT